MTPQYVMTSQLVSRPPRRAAQSGTAREWTYRWPPDLGGIVLDVISSRRRRWGAAVGAVAVAAALGGCAGEVPASPGSVESSGVPAGDRSQFVRPGTFPPSGGSRPMFTAPLRTVSCVYTPTGGGVVYLSQVTSSDSDGVCAGRRLLSEQEFDALGLVARCQLSGPPPGVGADAQGGYWVSVYSNSNRVDARAAERLCS